MNKIFYAIYNKEEDKFLSVENEYGDLIYNFVDFNKIHKAEIFKDEKEAEFSLKEVKEMPEFFASFEEHYNKNSLNNCSIVPVEITIRFDLVIEE